MLDAEEVVAGRQTGGDAGREVCLVWLSWREAMFLSAHVLPRRTRISTGKTILGKPYWDLRHEGGHGKEDAGR